jgi:glutathione S-transferase
MTYRLYYSPDSANLVIRMALEEMALAYESELAPRKRVDRDDVFFRLNPRGLLPVLIDEENDLPLFETGAILLYLADKHDRLAPRASDAKARGAFLKWLFMLSNTLHSDLRIRFYAERYVENEEDMAPLRLANKKRVTSHLKLIDSMLATNEGPWVLESGLTMCDFYLGCCVRWAQMYPVGNQAIDPARMDAFPKLSALLARLQDLPSVQKSLEHEGISGNAFLDVSPHLPPRERDKVGTGVS